MAEVQQGMEDNSQEPVFLLSCDDKKFEVKRSVACMSALVEDMLRDTTSIDEPIPLLHVKAPILEKIIAYCEHHLNNPPKEIEKPLKEGPFNDLVSEFDYQFTDVDREVLFEILIAANYLAIDPLIDLLCAKIGWMLKGKTPEEIRQMFNIVNDFTPEEEMQVREENKWCEDTP